MRVTIGALLVVGFLAGAIVGITIAKEKLGCGILLAVPIAMIVYVGWWQG